MHFPGERVCSLHWILGGAACLPEGADATFPAHTRSTTHVSRLLTIPRTTRLVPALVSGHVPALSSTFLPTFLPRKPLSYFPASRSLSPFLAVRGPGLYAPHSHVLIVYPFVVCGLMLSSDCFPRGSSVSPTRWKDSYKWDSYPSTLRRFFCAPHGLPAGHGRGTPEGHRGWQSHSWRDRSLRRNERLGKRKQCGRH